MSWWGRRTVVVGLQHRFENHLSVMIMNMRIKWILLKIWCAKHFCTFVQKYISVFLYCWLCYKRFLFKWNTVLLTFKVSTRMCPLEPLVAGMQRNFLAMLLKGGTWAFHLEHEPSTMPGGQHYRISSSSSFSFKMPVICSITGFKDDKVVFVSELSRYVKSFSGQRCWQTISKVCKSDFWH